MTLHTASSLRAFRALNAANLPATATVARMVTAQQTAGGSTVAGYTVVATLPCRLSAAAPASPVRAGQPVAAGEVLAVFAYGSDVRARDRLTVTHPDGRTLTLDVLAPVAVSVMASHRVRCTVVGASADGRAVTPVRDR